MKNIIQMRVSYWIIPLVLTLLFYLFLQYVLLIGYVPSASMEPTLKEGRFIIGFRIYSDPEVDDIIVFKKDNILHVKRIAAGPGDIVDLSKLVYMETIPMPERTANVLVVPDGCYFLLGDNTQNSLDSRYWEDPFISEKQIVAIIPTFEL